MIAPGLVSSPLVRRSCRTSWRSVGRTIRIVLLATICSSAAPGASAGESVALFIRGADRSGGFLEATNDTGRTEQLADINNASTSNGNHGWFQLAQTLRDRSFVVEQITEGVEPGNTSGQSQGLPVPLEVMDLSQYDVIVFGSNNASYGQTAVDAVEDYIRGGGGAIFISDANFGSDWADASNSDQPFLSRFGLTMNQDNGTYSLQRSSGEFLVPDHPILAGVDRFDGEGVTPITVGTVLPEGVEVDILALAKGSVRRNSGNFGSDNQGPTTPATDRDAVLLAATIDGGRLGATFDRNTFFNLNGAGTDIHRFDNQELAINLFQWVAVPEPTSSALFGAATATLLLLNRRRADRRR